MNTREQGQHFSSYGKDYQVDGVYFVRHNWIDAPKKSLEDTSLQKEYFVILENRELSFYYSTVTVNNTQSSLALNDTTETLILKIEFTDISKCHDQLNFIFENEVHRDMILDFFWDLYINNCFSHILDQKNLKLLLDSDVYIAGIVAKLIFYRLVLGRHPYDKKRKANVKFQQGSLMKDMLFKHQVGAIRYYWRFLLNESHESLFRYGYKKKKKLGFQQREDKWFSSLETELKIVLHTIRKKRFATEYREGTLFAEERDFVNSSARLLIKRYSLLDSLRYILPQKIGPKAAKLLIGMTTFLVLTIAVYFYHVVTSSTTSKPWQPAIDVLRWGIWAFVGIIPALHIIKIISSGKKDKLGRFYALFPNIYLPRLLIAITSGWLIFVTSEETTNFFDATGIKESKIFITLFCVLGLSMMVLMYNEIKSTAPSESYSTLAFRSVKILFLGFVMSFSLGYLFAGDLLNTLAMNNTETLTSVKEKAIKEMDYELDSLQFQLVQVNNLFERLNRLNIAADDMSSIDIEIDLFSSGLELSTLSKYLGENKGKAKTNVNGLLKIYRKNIQHLQADGLNAKLEGITFSDSIKKQIENGERLLNPDSLTLKRYRDGKFILIESLLTTREELNTEIAMTRQNLLTFSNPDSLKKHYFAQGDRFIKKTIIWNADSKDKETSSTTESYADTYIPFFQIINRSLIALFIGVFLQLVLQDKTITEPV